MIESTWHHQSTSSLSFALQESLLLRLHVPAASDPQKRHVSTGGGKTRLIDALIAIERALGRGRGDGYYGVPHDGM